MTGTVSITAPATDSAPGYSLNAIAIGWSFTGSPASTTQTRYRLTWQQTGTTTLVGDTGTVTSTATSAAVTGLASGVSYDVYVYITDSAGTTTQSAKRVVITTYQRSLPAVVSFGVDPTTEALILNVSNPTDSSSRPTVTTNTIYYRSTTTGGDWTLAGTTGNNGQYVFLQGRASTAYDFFVRTDSGADSTTYTTYTPAVTGVWLYDPVDLYGTLRHFPYGEAFAEALGVEETSLQFVGRQYPVFETGVGQTQDLTLSVTIPLSDIDWREQVEWWRTRKRSRRVLQLRDGRLHMHAGYLNGTLSVAPSRSGAVVSCAFSRVDYTQQTTVLPAASYTQGSNNDGGNGVYGNGSNGNGY